VKPTVLIFTTARWFPTARLAIAFSNAGCTVDAVCPSRHPLLTTRGFRRAHRYSDFAPLTSLARAIAATNPQLIIPGDDLATHRLHQLYRRESLHSGKDSSICALVERSMGPHESFPIVYQRASFMRLAAELGIRAPKTSAIANSDELRRWIAEVGLPLVIKADATSGGEGVKVVRTIEEALRAFRKLHAPPLLARAVKRALVDSDTTLLGPSLLRRRPVVSAQAFVDGREANSTVACWNGTVLAALHFEVVKKKHSTGHATVLRRIDHTEMIRAVETMVQRLNLSGVHGFDFMLETNTGNAYLIEINPRSTQVGHLTLGPGRDLPAALVAAVTGTGVQPGPALTENRTVALFPQEWTRDPVSPFLESAYHDVPWDEPELLRACMSKARRQNRSLSDRDWDRAVNSLMRLNPKNDTPELAKQSQSS
jgi:Carbamoyl-phosphate synthase L chain, ATP binding domain